MDLKVSNAGNVIRKITKFNLNTCNGIYITFSILALYSPVQNYKILTDSTASNSKGKNRSLFTSVY